jgi:hypothetical protein
MSISTSEERTPPEHPAIITITSGAAIQIFRIVILLLARPATPHVKIPTEVATHGGGKKFLLPAMPARAFLAAVAAMRPETPGWPNSPP